MTAIKPIKHWSRIMIDTSVIVDYVKRPERFSSNPQEYIRIKKTQQLIDFLTNTDRAVPVPILLISAVSIAELSKLPESSDNIKRLVELFSGMDVLFIDFTARTAAAIPTLFDSVLPDGQKFQWLKQLERDLQSAEISWARQWISDDLKIVASAHMLTQKLDALLSSDTKVFTQMATKLGLPLVHPDKIPMLDDGSMNVNVFFEGV
jgi:hypothetical protein